MFFSEQTKNRRRDPSQSTHIDLKILQWNAGGLSQNKKSGTVPDRG